jgi:hypothetical protein
MQRPPDQLERRSWQGAAQIAKPSINGTKLSVETQVVQVWWRHWRSGFRFRCRGLRWRSPARWSRRRTCCRRPRRGRPCATSKKFRSARPLA